MRRFLWVMRRTAWAGEFVISRVPTTSLATLFLMNLRPVICLLLPPLFLFLPLLQLSLLLDALPVTVLVPLLVRFSQMPSKLVILLWLSVDPNYLIMGVQPLLFPLVFS